MRKLRLRTILAAVAICVAVSGTARIAAQTTNKAAPPKKGAEEKSAQKSAHPFRGKLAAVDKAAKTITIGKSVYQITSETKINKGGKPATLEDGVVGEEATGYAKPMENGKMCASTLNFGPKPEGKTAAKKKQ